MTSVANVQKIKVTNTAPGEASVALIRGAASFPLAPSLQPGADGNFDLTSVSGLVSGDTFSVRVIIPNTGANAPDTTVLTFVANAGTEAVYIVGGSSTAPSITYQGTQKI